MSHDLFLGDADRFAAMWVPEPNSGCWLWIGAPCSVGYGKFRIGGRQERCHRASWRLHYGPIPTGMLVCHTCDNRACVNPRHLFLGASRDNVRDMWAKGRGSLPPTRRPTFARATVETVRRRIASGETATSVAADVGISLGYACQLANGRTRDCDV